MIVLFNGAVSVRGDGDSNGVDDGGGRVWNLYGFLGFSAFSVSRVSCVRGSFEPALDLCQTPPTRD